MKKTVIMADLISLALAAALVFVSCGSTPEGAPRRAPGAPAKAEKNYLPDEIGNLIITNGSGKSVDLFVNDVYLRSIPRGGTAFQLNVAAATNPNGTDFIVKVYDEDKVGSLDAPSTEGLLNTFAAVMFPASDKSRIMPIQIPEPDYRDEAPRGGAGSGRDVLVRFSYPYENSRMGTVSVIVYRGQVTTRSTVVTLRPSLEAIYVPLPADEPVQLNLLYTVAANNTITKFYWPDWENTTAFNSSLVMYDSNNRTPEFTVKPVEEMTTVTWVYPQDNYGSLMVYNRSTAIQSLRAAHIAADSKGQGGIGTIAANGGPNNINIGPIPGSYQFTPGQYVLTATGQGRNSRTVTTEINFEPGTKYIWIISDGAAVLEADRTANLAGNLDRLVQTWKIISNVPYADVLLGIESTDANVPSTERFIGETNSSGEYTGKLSLSGNLIPRLTYDNAAKVLIKITVAKKDYVSESQAINALAILEAGSDFVPDRFELKKSADRNTPGTTFQLSMDDGVVRYFGN
jgi:hypothetical protein